MQGLNKGRGSYGSVSVPFQRAGRRGETEGQEMEIEGGTRVSEGGRESIVLSIVRAAIYAARQRERERDREK